MIACKKCSRVNEDSNNFCYYCGFKFKYTQEEIDEQIRKEKRKVYDDLQEIKVDLIGIKKVISKNYNSTKVKNHFDKIYNEVLDIERNIDTLSIEEINQWSDSIVYEIEMLNQEIQEVAERHGKIANVIEGIPFAILTFVYALPFLFWIFFFLYLANKL